MKTILVINNKGGSGKTTLATNLAAYCAQAGLKPILLDLDPQRSSSDWQRARDKKCPPVVLSHRFNAKTGAAKVMIVDVPAALGAKKIQRLLHRADIALLPILPSPIDMRAAVRFVVDLGKDARAHKTKVGLVANRAKGNSAIFRELDAYLEKLDSKYKALRYITALRAHPNYLKAAEAGLGIHELPKSKTEVDCAEWQPLINWLDL